MTETETNNPESLTLAQAIARFADVGVPMSLARLSNMCAGGIGFPASKVPRKGKLRPIWVVHWPDALEFLRAYQAGLTGTLYSRGQRVPIHLPPADPDNLDLIDRDTCQISLRGNVFGIDGHSNSVLVYGMLDGAMVNNIHLLHRKQENGEP